LVPLASCGKKTNPALAGLWEGKVKDKYISLTFERDGHLIFGGDMMSFGTIFRNFPLVTDFGGRPAANTFTYKCISDTQLEVEGDFTALLDKLSAGGHGDGKLSPDWKEKIHPKETLTYAVTGKELTLTNDQGKSTKLKLVE
jgi:hypothetical protein